MSVIGVPYHLDEHLPDLDFALRPDKTVTAEPAAGDLWARLAPLYSAVADAVAAAGDGNSPVVVVTGDCLTALGTVAGLQRAGADPSVVWFDAHGDVQTPETTTSGYLAGMSLRMLTGHRPELIADRLGLRPIPERRMVLTGARDLDPAEADYLSGAQIRRCEVADLTAAGLPDGPLYVHVDMDVIEPADVPGLRFPTPGGPSAPEVADALRLLVGTGRVASVGIACSWMPGQGAAAAIGPQLAAALGVEQ
ncbi:arginase family protein [Paractinoplanes lichenicola]|uniref:Arginase family protein n=1 Tax=Paractinoplanes lichenicola TaxID=2802976 RepID=A0ABS1VDI6_9ACTN|nr:arginase family protein [Actinoplanes lichenicola]MBL7252746.1 arginase family protein [Actinoplanes lichenicola]